MTKITSEFCEQVESSSAQWKSQTLVITATFNGADPDAGKPFTAELTRTLSLESPTTLVVKATRAGRAGRAGVDNAIDLSKALKTEPAQAAIADSWQRLQLKVNRPQR